VKSHLGQIKYASPLLGEEEIQAAADVIRSGIITTAKVTERLECKIACLTGSKQAVAVSSCTAALHLALRAAGVNCGDKVVTTPLSYVATSHAIESLGAIPVFVDISPSDYNLSISGVESEISKCSPKAVLTVDYAGLPSKQHELKHLCENHGISLIADSAHSLMASEHQKMVGSIADFTCFSFDPIKIITAGEGGMVVSNEDLSKVKRLRSLGVSRNFFEREASEEPWGYDVFDLSLKFQLSDINAAIALTQLKSIKRFFDIRNSIASKYNSELSDLPIVCPPTRPDATHAYHIYPIKTESREVRNKLLKILKQNRINSAINYPPIHLFTYYRKKYGYRQGDYPCTEEVASKILSLPLHPGLTSKDLDKIISTVRSAIS